MGLLLLARLGARLVTHTGICRRRL